MNIQENELNLNEMAMVNGGDEPLQHVAGALFGMTAGAMVGCGIGGVAAGGPGAVVGTCVGGIAGGVAGGILGMRKIASWFD